MRTTCTLSATLFHAATIGAAIFALPSGALAFIPQLNFYPPDVYCTEPFNGNCGNPSPNGLDIADLMGDPNGEHPDVPDGFPEVAVCNSSKGSVTVFRNTGDWSTPGLGLVIDEIYPIQDGAGNIDGLAEPYDLQFVNMQMNPGSPALDPFMDIVVTVRHPLAATDPTQYVNILWNDGNGKFDVIPQSRIALGVTVANGLYVADLDADGKQDIVVAGNFAVLEGSGPEYPQVDVVRWANATYNVNHHDIDIIDDMTVVGRATDAVAAAVRLPQTNGRLDFVLSMTLSAGPGDRMGVFLNDGDTDSDGFPNWTITYSPAISSEGIVFGKLGSTSPPQDAVLASTDSSGTTFDNRAVIQRGDALGGFTRIAPGYLLFTLFNPCGLDIGKLSPDQNNDVAIACRAGRPPGGCEIIDHKGGVAVLLGQSNGTFSTTIKYFPTDLVCQEPERDPLPTFVRIGDLNDDGQNDIVASNNGSHSIGVLINKTLVSIP